MLLLTYRKFNHSPINHYCPNSQEGACSQCSTLMHSACTESFAVSRTAVALKHNVYDDGGLYSCSMVVAVYYQTYCIRLHFS